MNRHQEIEALLADRRERLAQDAFDMSKILALIINGEEVENGSVRISMEDFPIDLRGTRAALRAQQELEELGMVVRWERRIDALNNDIYEMVVSWDNSAESNFAA